MSDAFTDVAKMKKIKEEIKAHEGQVVEMTLENGRKRQKNRLGKLIEVYPSLFIVEFGNVEEINKLMFMLNPLLTQISLQKRI